MENNYKIIVFGPSSWTARSLEYELDIQYNQGWDFVQMIPNPENNTEYWMIFKKEKDFNGVTLIEVLDSVGDSIKNNHPIRIYSKQNHSIVGHILNGKELIPDNVLKYKYISAEVQNNTRIKNSPTILVITIE